MCGINGFYGNFAAGLAKSMNDITAHRGPDGSGIYYNSEAKIGLAHRRLAIIDLSNHADQPLWDATKTIAVVFNGEIFNYLQLKQELLAKGFQFLTNTDTEILVNLYLAYGIDMLNKLNGMFAFAIYDTRSEELFIARDQLGIKPLYYAELPKGFLFSSELKALLQEPSLSREINPQAVQSYLTYLWSPATQTMLQTVKKLEPGHALIISAHLIKKHWRFYDLPYTNPIKANMSFEEARDNLDQHLRKAVERQLISDVPVGAFLSGGLDSSSIVALAKQIKPDFAIECFTINLGQQAHKAEGFIDDLPFAKQVAKHLQVNLHVVDVDHSICEGIEHMLYHLDEPQADPAAINTYLIAKLARDQGVKVLLSGAGGDDIFTGYRRHYALLKERYWQWLPGVAKAILAKSSQWLPQNLPLARRLAKVFQYAGLAANDRLASYFYWINPQLRTELFSDNFKYLLQKTANVEPLLNSLANLPEATHDLNKMLYLEAKHFLADHNLNYTDKMSMAAGVEVRVPLLDIELIDFVTQLPIDMKQRGRIGKWLFKKNMEAYLPKQVIYRPKTGFGAPLRHWVKHELNELIQETLSKHSIDKRGIFNANTVSKLIALNKQNKIDATYTIFSLLCIELWCRMFCDKVTQSSLNP